MTNYSICSQLTIDHYLWLYIKFKMLQKHVQLYKLANRYVKCQSKHANMCMAYINSYVPHQTLYVEQDVIGKKSFSFDSFVK